MYYTFVYVFKCSQFSFDKTCKRYKINRYWVILRYARDKLRKAYPKEAQDQKTIVPNTSTSGKNVHSHIPVDNTHRCHVYHNMRNKHHNRLFTNLIGQLSLSYVCRLVPQPVNIGTNYNWSIIGNMLMDDL